MKAWRYMSNKRGMGRQSEEEFRLGGIWGGWFENDCETEWKIVMLEFTGNFMNGVRCYWILWMELGLLRFMNGVRAIKIYGWGVMNTWTVMALSLTGRIFLDPQEEPEKNQTYLFQSQGQGLFNMAAACSTWFSI